jgi:hypothetical protein
VLTFKDLIYAHEDAVNIIRDRHHRMLMNCIGDPTLTSEKSREVQSVLSALIDALNHLQNRGVAVPGLYTGQVLNWTPFHDAADDMFRQLNVKPQGNDIDVLADDIRSVADELDSDSITAARELQRRIGGSLASYIKCIRPKEGR